MKQRAGHVSNSSSCSFYITNTSDKPKTVIDFAIENLYMVKDYNESYYYPNPYSEFEFIKEAYKYFLWNEEIFKPGEGRLFVFSDSGEAFEEVCSGVLYRYNSSKNFSWHLDE